MATKSPVKILTDYFNQGEGKRPTREWGQEIKDLKASMTEEAYAEFAAEVARVAEMESAA